MLKDIAGIVWRIIIAVIILLCSLAYMMLVILLTFVVIFPIWSIFWLVAFLRRNQNYQTANYYKQIFDKLYCLMTIYQDNDFEN